MDVEIWLLKTDEFPVSELEEAGKMLSPEELISKNKFVFEKDRKAYLLTRVLQKYVLENYTGIPFSELDFVKNEYGWPELISNQKGEGLQFNISHTDDLIVMAIIRKEIYLGVDVENTSRGIDLSIADNFFSPIEVAELKSLPDHLKEPRFWELWTLKESYIKARRIGLTIPLDSFHFHFQQYNRLCFADTKNVEISEIWHFAHYQLSEHHLLSLAYEAESLLNITFKKLVSLNNYKSTSYIHKYHF